MHCVVNGESLQCPLPPSPLSPGLQAVHSGEQHVGRLVEQLRVDRAAAQLLLLDQHTFLGGRETREERNNDVWGSSSIAGPSLTPSLPPSQG